MNNITQYTFAFASVTRSTYSFVSGYGISVSVTIKPVLQSGSSSQSETTNPALYAAIADVSVP